MHKRVYSVFQINLIISIITTVSAAPFVAIVSYIFNFNELVSVENILYISLGFTLIVAVTTFLYTFLTREKTRRRLKPSYQKEYMFSLATTALGVFGTGVLFLYLGGDQFYMLHVIIPLGILDYSILYVVGDRFFNVRFIRR